MSNYYLTLDDVCGIHQDSIEAFGGSHGARDCGGLESAGMRPRSGYYPDVISEAAALWESLHLFYLRQAASRCLNWKLGSGHTQSPR